MDNKTYNVKLKAIKTNPEITCQLNAVKGKRVVSSLSKKSIVADLESIVFTEKKHALENFYGGPSKIGSTSFKKIPDKIRTAPGITNLNRSFCGARNVTEIDLSQFETPNVVDMSLMFADCGKVKSLDLFYLDTSKVTNMEDMFASCYALVPDFSNFDTHNVENMQSMFSGSFQGTGYIDLDLTSFNVSKVTDMREMFSQCRKLRSVDLTGWDTSKVQDFGSMFYSCEKLTEIKGVIDMASATSYKNMFDYYVAQALTKKVKIMNMPNNFFSDSNNARAKSKIEVLSYRG